MSPGSGSGATGPSAPLDVDQGYPDPVSPRGFRIALGVFLVLLLGGGIALVTVPGVPSAVDNVVDATGSAAVAGDAPDTAAPGPSVPGSSVPGSSVPGSARAPLANWADRVGAATGIPARVVQAYGHADLLLRLGNPSCHLSWNTLAGIGRVESNHGRFGGAEIRADGSESQPVIGVPLDGSPGVRSLPAAEQGRLDGDPVHQHAVGPMQFLPSTWQQFADPGADPQNIDAAALTAARYLCAGGRDLATGRGWRSAVLSYNDSESYAALVLRFADDYAAMSRSA